MAPKKGGGGSSSGGSSSSGDSSSGGSSGSSGSYGSYGKKTGSTCQYCSYEYRLDSDGYASSAARAVLALQIILFIIVVTCMVLVSKRPWLKLDQKKDRYKYILYMLMGATQLLYLLIAIVDSILHQVEVWTTYGYFIIYIFRSLSWRLSDIFMVTIILRCLEGARNAMQPNTTKLRIPHFLAIGLLSILSLTAWALYIKQIAAVLQDGIDSSFYATAGVDTAYSSIAFVVSVEMLALVAFFALKKAIPATSILLLLAIAGSYWLSALVNIIFYATYYWNSGDFTNSLGTASSVIAILAAMAIFIALAMLSRLSNTRTRQLANRTEPQPFNGQPQPVAAWSQVPKNDQQSFSTDTSYQGGGYQNNQWAAPNPNYGQYGPTNPQDPAAQPLYPTQTYTPPQQTSHVYDSSNQYPPMQQPPMQQPNMQQPQRFYGNNHAYSAVPQAAG